MRIGMVGDHRHTWRPLLMGVTGAPGERMSELDAVRGARLLRAMGSPPRVQVMVAMSDGAPVSARELTARMSDPDLGLAAAVYHLQQLADAGALVRVDPTPSSAADCRL